MNASHSTHSQADYAALLLRVSLGILFLAHAGLKIFTFTIPGTVQFFETIGYPGFFAYLVILGELGGGLALILGAWTRAVSIALLPIMIGATLQHLPNGWMFGSTGGGWEFPAFWTVTLVVQALLGAGAYALKPEKLLGFGGAGRTAQAAR
ncbi:DoxX family protein [Skermanella mucosa]|uniref:DoxX family protein n=1 Tax=Skermanella mucosa TaxID=1789672 RepID=UPI00192A6E25|nr:DoxX family protein [Skermanella mucosa]UEM23180.1 DoxX family protein [Skermanella mucosa]